MGTAAGDRSHTYGCILRDRVERATEYAVRIPTVQVDVHAGMPADKPRNRERIGHVLRGRRLEGQRHIHGDAAAAGAADGEDAFVFRVEVEQHAPFQHGGIELGSAGQSRLFVDGEQKLQGGM